MFYLRPESFSPRYADEFYTVEVAVSPPSSQEMIVSSPPSPPPPPMVEGRTHHPAVYYSLVVRSGSRSRTVRRRYSQFRWLREEIGRRSALIPSYSPSSPRAEDLPLLPPRTCWGHRWSDDKFIMQRAELLGEFLLDLLSTRGGGTPTILPLWRFWSWILMVVKRHVRPSWARGGRRRRQGRICPSLIRGCYKAVDLLFA